MSWIKPNPTTKQEARIVATTLSKQTLEQIFAQVDSDPLAGRGHFTKREILIDRILAHVQTVAVQERPATPRPILDNEAHDVLDLKQAVNGKK